MHKGQGQELQNQEPVVRDASFGFSYWWLELTGGSIEAHLMFGTALSDGAISHPRSREGGVEAWFAAEAAHSRSWV